MNVGHAVFQPRAMHGIFYYPLSVKLQHERDFSGHLKHACMSINVSEIVFFLITNVSEIWERDMRFLCFVTGYSCISISFNNIKFYEITALVSKKYSLFKKIFSNIEK